MNMDTARACLGVCDDVLTDEDKHHLDLQGGSRNYVNRQVGRAKKVFKWAAEEKWVSAGVHQSPQAVPGEGQMGNARYRKTMYAVISAIRGKRHGLRQYLRDRRDQQRIDVIFGPIEPDPMTGYSTEENEGEHENRCNGGGRCLCLYRQCGRDGRRAVRGFSRSNSRQNNAGDRRGRRCHGHGGDSRESRQMDK